MFKFSMFKMDTLNTTLLASLLVSLTLSGCQSVSMPSVFNKGTRELPKFGPDAIEYQCANYQSFGFLPSKTGETAWVMFDDRQLNLNRDSADKNLYTLGAVTLHLNGDQTTVKDGERLNYEACKAKTEKS